MSKFNTELKDVLVSPLSRIPKGSHITAVTVSADKRSIAVEWENDALQTNYFTPTEFPESNLEGDLPDGVRLKSTPVIIPNAVYATNHGYQTEGDAKKPATLPLKVDKSAPKSKTVKR